jgi:hypothetical protein
LASSYFYSLSLSLSGNTVSSKISLNSYHDLGQSLLF